MATVPDGQVQASSWIHLPALRPPPPLPNPCNDLPAPIGEKVLINKTLNYRETIQPKYNYLKVVRLERLLLLPVLQIRIRDRDPGSGAFLTPGSGIRNRFFPDPGSLISDARSQTHIFE
jgi:hypothetical protein